MVGCVVAENQGRALDPLAGAHKIKLALAHQRAVKACGKEIEKAVGAFLKHGLLFLGLDRQIFTGHG